MTEALGGVPSPEMEAAFDILLVDNDERISQLVLWFLDKRGYGVRAATSFREARELLAERTPDLLISDIDLGVEDAREELPRLAAEGLLPPTLVVSGFLDAQVTREMRAIPGVLSTLPKPFDFEVLSQRLEECRAEIDAGVVLAPPVPPAMAVIEDEDDEEGWIEIVPHAPEPADAPAPDQESV